MPRDAVRVAASRAQDYPVSRLQARKFSEEERLTMIRAIYRWRVKSGEEEKFIQAWTQGTAAIRAKVVGAGGSLLMRSHHDRSEFMALACWHSMEDWQAFAAENDSAPPDPEAFRVMGAVSEHLSTEILEEVADLLDCGP